MDFVDDQNKTRIKDQSIPSILADFSHARSKNNLFCTEKKDALKLAYQSTNLPLRREQKEIMDACPMP
jgi:hypothetical protein